MVGAVVWQRIVKVLGDINKIPEPAMHHLAFQTLLSVWRRLEEVSRVSSVRVCECEGVVGCGECEGVVGCVREGGVVGCVSVRGW